MKKIKINNSELKNKADNDQYSVFKKLAGNSTTVVCSDDDADDVEYEFEWDYDAQKDEDYIIEDYTPATLQELVIYVNEYMRCQTEPILDKTSDKKLADIITGNGWTLDFGKMYGVCHNGNEYVVLDHDCEAEYIDNYVEATNITAIDFETYCANNPESNVSDDNWADWKQMDEYRGYTIEVHSSECRDWEKDFSCNEVVVNKDVCCSSVLCDVTRDEVYAWIDEQINA